MYKVEITMRISLRNPTRRQSLSIADVGPYFKPTTQEGSAITAPMAPANFILDLLFLKQNLIHCRLIQRLNEISVYRQQNLPLQQGFQPAALGRVLCGPGRAFHKISLLLVVKFLTTIQNCSYFWTFCNKLVHHRLFFHPPLHGRLARWSTWSACEVGEATEGL